MAKTKKQREAEQLAALEQRCRDLFAGATCEVWIEDETYVDPDGFMQFVLALNCVFLHVDDEVNNSYLWSLWHLENYADPVRAAEFLFEHGVRA